MENKLQRFFEKNHRTMADLLYILRAGRKTVFYFLDGSTEENYIPLKSLLTILPARDFIHINKSVIVNKRYIAFIKNGIYTMVDGRELKGRVRTPGAHTHTMRQLKESSLAEQVDPNALTEKEFFKQFAILENMPLAFCIIELVFDKDGHGMDFIFRYCNKEMAVLERTPVENMINRSFYEVFENGDKKWLAAYTDVALNGATRILHDYSPEVDRYLSIYCFQPREGFCACALIDQERSDII